MTRIKKALFYMIVVGIGVFVYINYKYAPQSNAKDVEGISDLIIDPRPVKRECVIEDTISYLYYTNPDESDIKNNKVGIYIYAEEERFITLADQLVNSNGGDWGYVLIPYNVKDRDNSRWNRVFGQLRSKHLIPVIQLHDVNLDNYKEQTEEAAEFLNSFIWPTRKRYISVYNEPNDAKFWYNRVDPAEYARILNYTVTTFKKENTDFFVMNGALNVSAPTHADGTYLEAFEYMRRMEAEIPGIFSRLDGWASHPYPMPNFSGSTDASGRWSIQAYDDELRFLEEEFGVKDIPVFITETGWAHAEGTIYNSSYLPVDKVAENFIYAYENVWLKDDRVVAVMPFTIRYNAPYDHFSWIDDRNMPYAHFIAVKSLKKVAGTPAHLAEKVTKIEECN